MPRNSPKSHPSERFVNLIISVILFIVHNAVTRTHFLGPSLRPSVCLSVCSFVSCLVGRSITMGMRVTRWRCIFRADDLVACFDLSPPP